MADLPKSSVGVVLINGLGLYKSNMFGPLDKLLFCPQKTSFLIANKRYFYGGNDKITPPTTPFPNNYRPPEYGKPLLLIAEGKVPKNIAKAYVDTYSLDGPFGRIANLGYLCVPNIDLICQHITSTNPLLQKRALKVIARDKVVIDLINLCLDAEEDLTDPKMKEKVIDRVFFALDYLKYIPLEKEIKLDTKGLNREYRKEASKGDEGKYAEIGKSVSDGLIKLGRSYQDANVVHSKQ